MRNKKCVVRLLLVFTLLALGSTSWAAYQDGWEITYETGNTPADYAGMYTTNQFSPDSSTWDGNSPGIYSIIADGNAAQQLSWGFDTPFFPGNPWR